MEDLITTPFWENQDTEQKLDVATDEHLITNLSSPADSYITPRSYVDEYVYDSALDPTNDSMKVFDGASWNDITAVPTIDIQNVSGNMTIEANGLHVRTTDGTVDILQKLEELEQKVIELTCVKEEPVTMADDSMVVEIRDEINKELIANIMELATEIDHNSAFARAMKGV